MRNQQFSAEIRKIVLREDFRIDFDAAPALIGLRANCRTFIMPDDQPESAAPLAEISHGPSAFDEFLERNQKNLIIAAIVIALGVAAFVVWQGVEQGNQETAGAELNKAGNLAELQTVLENHPDSKASGSAAVLLANQQWTEGKQDEAISTLKDFIAAKPDHSAIPAAMASLGAKLMSQGKSSEAAEIFSQLADDPAARYIAPYALICLGDIAKAAGETDKAETSYYKVTTDFSDSQFVSAANERISTLKATPPVEIDPPATPETTSADIEAALKAAADNIDTSSDSPLLDAMTTGATMEEAIDSTPATDNPMLDAISGDSSPQPEPAETTPEPSEQ